MALIWRPCGLSQGAYPARMLKVWEMGSRIAKGCMGTLLLACAAMVPTAQARMPAQPSTDAIGRWINPRGTVKVETGNCGADLCGWVIWASPQALADAQDAGIKSLIGTELLRSYRGTARGRWQGEVFVPDMGRTFYSTITQIGADRLKISGCILGGLLCKTQIWQRG
jgi:uncharacterized protein (DUF2147 family)